MSRHATAHQKGRQTEEERDMPGKAKKQEGKCSGGRGREGEGMRRINPEKGKGQKAKTMSMSKCPNRWGKFLFLPSFLSCFVLPILS